MDVVGVNGAGSGGKNIQWVHALGLGEWRGEIRTGFERSSAVSCDRPDRQERFFGMRPDDLQLPPGTSMLLAESCLFLTIDWQGLNGRHIIRLQVTLDDSNDLEREKAITTSVELFRNMVGLEVIDDAVGAGEWPVSGAVEHSSDSAGEWCRRSRS